MLYINLRAPMETDVRVSRRQKRWHMAVSRPRKWLIMMYLTGLVQGCETGEDVSGNLGEL